MPYEQAPVGEQARELLGVQGVPSGLLQHQRLHLGRQHRLTEQGGDERGGVGVAER
jgi:hypothetical protein